jgi:uncharacterized repeat protein (TIGR01451 family)
MRNVGIARVRQWGVGLVLVAVLAASVTVGSTPVGAQPPQPTTAVPPIIGNSENGVVRDVPLKYLGAIDAFENNAIAEVIDDRSLPPDDFNAVKSWGRDAVRTQEFLDLLAIIGKSPGSRTTNEALVYEWFQNVYQKRVADQTQAALDQYLEWSGLRGDPDHPEAHLSDDPVSIVPGGGGYCNFHPPAALDTGIGIFGGKYSVAGLPQCHGSVDQCSDLATGCPIPWPTVEQFQQWGTYLSMKKIFDDPVFSNMAMELSTGVGLAATLSATGISTALSRAYLAVPTSGTGLFAKVFPFIGRVNFVKGAAEAGRVATEAAKTAARVSAGIIRAGAIAFVAGTVITAIVTIGLEAWTIYEHQQIPIILKKARDDNQGVKDEFGNVTFPKLPDLAAVLAKDNGAGVLLSTFLTTTAIDVDPDCQLPTDENAYSNFPCANAPAPAVPNASDDLFYVSSAEAGGLTSSGLRTGIYTVNPIDSSVFTTANEASGLSGNGWFVTTKYDGNFTANLHDPTTPGASLQTLRLYYRDWEGKGKVAERKLVNGKPMFIVASLDDAELGGCATPPTGGAVSKCVTDTIQYVEPDGDKMSATIVGRDAAGPTADAVVPERAVAGSSVTLTARGKDSLLSHGPWTYQWTVPGVGVLNGAQVTTALKLAGTNDVRLDVTDVNFPLIPTTRHFTVLVAQNTTVEVGSVPATLAAYGSSPQIWASVHPVKGEGVQCTWNQSTGEIGCVSPTGSVQFFLDGNPLGGPVPVTPNFVPPCITTDPACGIFFGDNVVYAPTQSLPPITVAPGSHPTVTAVYYGDDKFVGSTSGPRTYDVVTATPSVTLTSGTSYPSPTQPVTLTASVQAPNNPVGNPTGAPTGTVQFLANGGGPLLGPVPVNSDGTATLPNVTLQFVNSLAVSYSGDTNYASVSAPATPITFAPPCAAGSYSATGSAPCTPAPQGYFVATGAATSATPCATGSYQDQVGQSSCVPAPVGSYVSTTGATAATLCPAGTTTAAVAATSASDCVPIQQAQTISFAAPSTGLVGGGYTPTATATSGLTVTFTLGGSSTGCALSAGVVTYTGTGTCRVNANQAGDATHLPASQVQGVTVISKNAQTVAFTSAAPTAAKVGGATYTPTAVASPGARAATITVDASSSGVCSITAGVVSFQAPGTCTLNANQAGDGTYLPAGQVQQVFSVYDAPSFTMASPALTGSVGTLYGYTFQASGSPQPTYALSVGASAWLSIDATTGVLSGTPPTGTTSFTYSVVATNLVGNATAGPFTVTVTTPPPPSTRADLSISVSCPSTGKVGVNASCTVTVKNSGPATAKSVVVGAALPGSLSKVSASSGASWWHNVVAWKISSLASGSSQSFTVTFKPRTAGKATVGAVTVSANPDPKWSNNASSASITITKT